MSANAMKPTFTDREGYIAWRNAWKRIYKDLSDQIVTDRQKLVLLSRENDPKAASVQRELGHKRVMAHKMMSLMTEAKLRRDRILEMHKQIAEQNATFPLSLSNIRNIDFHYNKISNEFTFMPMWTLKAAGKAYYIHHIESMVPWTTRELPEGSTRGMLRIKRGDILFKKEGSATITVPNKEFSKST